MRYLLYVLYSVAGLAVLAGAFVLFFNRGMGAVRATTVSDLDLSKVADGTYTGRYSRNRWGYTVVVTVKDGRIENIEITECINAHIYQGLNQKMVGRVVEEQSLDIDTIGGASISTRAFLKAVDNALTGNSPAPPE